MAGSTGAAAPQVALRGAGLGCLALATLVAASLPMTTGAGEAGQVDAEAEIEALKKEVSKLKETVDALATTEAPSTTRPDMVENIFKKNDELWNDFAGTVFCWNWMILISMLLMLQWHVRTSFRKWAYVRDVNTKLGGLPSVTARQFALDILILSIYYDKDSPFRSFVAQRPFVVSCCFIVFDNVIMYYACLYMGTLEGLSCTGKLRKTRSLTESLSREREMVAKTEAVYTGVYDEDEQGSKNPATCIYMDISWPFHRILPIFFIQLCLFLLYVQNLNGDTNIKIKENVKFFAWFVGCLIQMYAGNQQLGKKFGANYWFHLLEWGEAQTHLGDKVKYNGREATILKIKSLETKIRLDGETAEKWVLSSDIEGKDKEKLAKLREQKKTWVKLPMSLGWEWKCRAFMDFGINSIARLIIMYSFPIMLCVEEPLDFVKDCTAIFFITTLDDIDDDDDQKSLPLMLAKLKLRLYCEATPVPPPELLNICRFDEAEKKAAEDSFVKERRDQVVKPKLELLEGSTYIAPAVDEVDGGLDAVSSNLADLERRLNSLDSVHLYDNRDGRAYR